MSDNIRLSLYRKWYEMISSGEKTEEYRDIKPFYISRLVEDTSTMKMKPIKTITFTLGRTYNPITFECKGIEIGKGKKEWGAPDEDVFILKIGNRIN